MRIKEIYHDGIIQLADSITEIDRIYNVNQNIMDFKSVGDKAKQVYDELIITMDVDNVSLFDIEILLLFTKNIRIKNEYFSASPVSMNTAELSKNYPDLFKHIHNHNGLLSSVNHKDNMYVNLLLNGNIRYECVIQFYGIDVVSLLCGDSINPFILTKYPSICKESENDISKKIKLISSYIYELFVEKFYGTYFQYDQKRDLISDFIIHDKYFKKMNRYGNKIMVASIHTPEGVISMIDGKEVFNQAMNLLSSSFKKYDISNFKFTFLVPMNYYEYIHTLLNPNISVRAVEQNSILYSTPLHNIEIDDSYKDYTIRINSFISEHTKMKELLKGVDAKTVMEPTHVSSIYGLTFVNQNINTMIEIGGDVLEYSIDISKQDDVFSKLHYNVSIHTSMIHDKFISLKNLIIDMSK